MKINKVLFLFIATMAFYASSGQYAVKGVVIDSEGPLPGAAIVLKGKSIGVTSDFNGSFLLDGVPEGEQQIEISFIGHEKLTKTITGVKGQVVDLGNIILKEGAILEEVQVNGKMEEGQRKAIQMVQLSPRQISVKSSEGIEKLPDRNAAEALQRMPGAVMEGDQGEGRYISFRGTPMDWSSALVNGDRLPTTGEEMEGRNMNFDILPTSLIEYIEYNQSLSPNIEGDAIGGVANFFTKYTPQKKELTLDVDAGWNFKAQKPMWSGALQFGDRSKDKRWGYVIGGSVYNRSWATDNYEIFYGQNSSHAMERLELRDYNGERTTYGVNAKVDYKASEKFTIYAQGFYGKLNDNEYNRKTLYDWAAGVGQSIRLQNINNIMQNNIVGGELGGEIKTGKNSNLKLKAATYHSRFGYGDVPFGKGDNRNGYFVTQFEKQVEYIDYIYLDEEGNRIPFEDRHNAYTRLRLLDIDSPYDDYGDPANNINPVYNNIVGAGRSTDTMFQFKNAWSETMEHLESDPLVVSADWDYQISKKVKLMIGGKYRTKMGERKRGMETWDRSPQYRDPIVLGEFDTEDIPHRDAFLGEAGGYYQNDLFQFLTEDELSGFLNNNEYRLVYVPLNPVVNDLYEQFVGSNFRYTEDVSAGYLMFQLEPTSRLSVNVGLRLENTHVEVIADTLDTYVDSLGVTQFDISETKLVKDYISPLPMLGINYKLNEKANLRMSLTRSFRRQNFNEIKPGAAEIHFSDFHVMSGNPNLRPTYAWNADMAYQYFFGLEGMFTMAVFYKYVTDHIYTSYNTEELVPRFNVVSKTYQNAPFAHVAGFEVALDKKLGFIASVLKNFRVQVNYSFTKSSMEIESRPERQELPRQAKDVFNAQLGYETRKWSADIGLNYKSAYLKEFSSFGVRDPDTGEFINLRTNNDFDTYQGKSLTLDASLNYNISKRFTITAEANNLLNTPFVEYRGRVDRPIRTEYYSIRALIGIKYTL